MIYSWVLFHLCTDWRVSCRCTMYVINPLQDPFSSSILCICKFRVPPGIGCWRSTNLVTALSFLWICINFNQRLATWFLFHWDFFFFSCSQDISHIQHYHQGLLCFPGTWQAFFFGKATEPAWRLLGSQQDTEPCWAAWVILQESGGFER